MNQPSPPPRIVDRYALFDVIATGGMASVHLGRLMGPVGFSRTVAIKRLHENFARDPEFVAMFLDEARLVARIRHPNVVQTLDVVASTQPQELLLVMEYVLGESLAQLIKHASAAARPIAVPVVVDIVTSVLRGLHAAHEATNEKGEPLNVVHRDVSPHNILVGSDGVARVLDFGIAKAVGYMQETRSGQVKGKLRYMPPEQISGKEVSRATDVYAACVVLWETLTCRRLFAGAHDGEIVHRVLEGRVPPPSKFRRDVPRALDQIVLRGLNRNPAERFQTAEAMVDALETVAPPVTRSTVSKWVMESAPDEIRRREQCLARVESSITTPALSPSSPTAAPAAPSNGDSTVSTVGSLSHSLIQDIPKPSRWSGRKRLLLAAGAVTLLGLAAVTPKFLRGPLLAEEQKATLGSDSPRDHEAAQAPVKPVETAPAPAATPAASSADPAATAAPEASSAPTARKRATAPSSSKRPRGKDGAFDRIYKRD